MLTTARLTLRRPVPADTDEIWRIHRDPVACAHNPSDLIATRSQAAERCRQWIAHWERHGFGYFVVRSGAAVAGFCGVKQMRLHDVPVLNLFYRFDPAVWGAGLASEAAAAVVGWAPSSQPVIARVRPGNAASARVAMKAGLQRAPDLDVDGEDGLDWIFVTGWPVSRHGGAPVTAV